MNTEDDEFNRIERESKARLMAVEYALKQSDKKIARHYSRMQKFVDEGLPENEAFDLAEAMWNRDEDPFDDRRVCFECKHLAVKFCSAINNSHDRPSQPMRFVLQRCPSFKLKEKS
jgi:hypothetical protein